jgi:hypothetical protein
MEQFHANLMPHQYEPFNGDHYVQAEFLKLRDQFKIKTAVETGTCLGSTTLWLSEHFKNVFTSEISEEYLRFALNRFEGKNNIRAFLGDSASALKDCILPHCGDDTIIFNDAHWGDSYCPLQDELKAIAERGIKPIIAIHDFQVPDHPELGYDCIGAQPFNYEWLKPCFDAIYGENGYNHYFNSLATEIKRGLIYLVPVKKISKSKKK